MRKFGMIVAAIGALGLVQFVDADSLSTYGDATAVSGGYQLTSSTSGIGWAGLDDTISGTLTGNGLSNLSAGYQMTTGTFGAGAPRFSLADSGGNEAYVYFGTPQAGGTFADPLSGTAGSTGNYADSLSSDARVQINGFGGINTGYTYLTWAQFLSDAGGVQIAKIYLDLDGGYSQPGGTQQMTVTAFDVNSNNVLSPSATAAPLPSTAWAGLGLLGGLGLLTVARRRMAAAAA